MLKPSRATTAKPTSPPPGDLSGCGGAIEMLSLFANGTRLRILCLLDKGDYCVNEIAQLAGARHSNVSQQLKMLTLAGYLTKRRKDKSIIYHLDSPRIRRLLAFMHREFEGEY